MQKTPRWEIPPDILRLLEVIRKERKIYLLPLINQNRGNVSIATLVEEMKPVVADKDDFECRDKSKVIAYFGIFGLSSFLWSFRTIRIVTQGRNLMAL